MKGKLLIFSAPSGAGKTTIVRKLLENKDLNLEFSISATTRQKRENEVNGKDYYFLSTQEFRKKIAEGEFLEWEEVYRDLFYGTLKSEVDRILDSGKNVALDVDVVGALNIKEIYGDRALTIFVKPPSIEVLKERLEKRSTNSKEDIAARLAKAHVEMAYAPRFDYILINDQLEKAIEEATKIVSDFIK